MVQWTLIIHFISQIAAESLAQIKIHLFKKWEN